MVVQDLSLRYRTRNPYPALAGCGTCCRRVERHGTLRSIVFQGFRGMFAPAMRGRDLAEEQMRNSLCWRCPQATSQTEKPDKVSIPNELSKIRNILLIIV